MIPVNIALGRNLYLLKLGPTLPEFLFCFRVLGLCLSQLSIGTGYSESESDLGTGKYGSQACKYFSLLSVIKFT